MAKLFIEKEKKMAKRNTKFMKLAVFKGEAGRQESDEYIKFLVMTYFLDCVLGLLVFVTLLSF